MSIGLSHSQKRHRVVTLSSSWKQPSPCDCHSSRDENFQFPFWPSIIGHPYLFNCKEGYIQLMSLMQLLGLYLQIGICTCLIIPLPALFPSVQTQHKKICCRRSSSLFCTFIHTAFFYLNIDFPISVMLHATKTI